jgi:rhamnogalacturonan endolyase
MRSFLVNSLLAAASYAGVANAITLTTNSGSYVVDAQSSNAFVVTFSRSNCDITSLRYRGTEVQTQSGSRSHIASGFSSPSVSAQSLTVGGVNYVKVTCTQSELTHYYVIRNGDSMLHMATYVHTALAIGEHRWIGRFINSVLPNDDVSQASDVKGSTSTVEGSDVFVVNAQTRSKFYSSQRFIDDKVHCLSGNDIRACMVLFSFEID